MTTEIERTILCKNDHLQFGLCMSGVIKTYQECPACGAKFPTSKGETPILCTNGCQTQPTKLFIELYWKKRSYRVYRDKTGRTLHHWDHARETLTELRALIRRGAFDPVDYTNNAQTFNTFWEAFLTDYSEGTSTRDKLESIGRHFEPLFDKNMKEIIGLDIKEWWLDLRDKGLSPKYLNDIRQWVQRVFNEAYRLQIIERVPSFPKAVTVPKKKIDWLTEEEQDQIFQWIPDQDKPLFFFLFHVGCRVMEAAALQWEDIDWNDRIITIQRTVDRHGKLGPPKDRGAREIPMTKAVRDMLVHLRSSQNPTPISGTVFRFISDRYHQKGRRDNQTYSYEYLRETWHSACEKAGIRKIQLKTPRDIVGASSGGVLGSACRMFQRGMVIRLNQ